MRYLNKILFSLLICVIASAAQATDNNFEKKFALTIEKWTKNAEGEFHTTSTCLQDKVITLLFDHSKITEEFDGFSLAIISYRGVANSSLTVEQNLFKEGHPFNDPDIGISRNHFTIGKPEGNQINYINYYVNVDSETKYRVRLWELLPNSNGITTLN